MDCHLLRVRTRFDTARSRFDMYKAEPFPGSKPISVVRCPGCQALDEPRMGEGIFGGMCVLPCQACGAAIPISATMLPRHVAAATADKATAAWAASVSALGGGGGGGEVQSAACDGTGADAHAAEGDTLDLAGRAAAAARAQALLDDAFAARGGLPTTLRVRAPDHADGTTSGKAAAAIQGLQAECDAARVRALDHADGTTSGKAAAAIQAASTKDKAAGIRRCASAKCDKAGKLKCGGCGKAYYCGRPCQKAHWKAHKAGCKRLQEGAEDIMTTEEGQRVNANVMADPEIQALMMDDVFEARMMACGDPAVMAAEMRDPVFAANIVKLQRAGLIEAFQVPS